MTGKKIYTDHYTPKPDIAWDCPEHDIAIVPKRYKVKTLLNKQNQPVIKTEIKQVDMS